MRIQPHEGFVTCLAFVAILAAAGVGTPAGFAAASPSPRQLRILSDTVLGEPLQYAVDLRWASDHSVYLALKRSGVVEYDLAGKGASVPMIPGEKEPGGFWISFHLGVSTDYLATGSPLFALTWRRRDSPLRKEEAFEAIDDIDVHENRVAVAGVRRDSKGQFAPDGAIAWMGSLDKSLSDLRPLIFDAGGPGAPNANACGTLMLGATRFLPDGSLVIVPGIQPGIYRFDLQGKLVQTLDTVALGIDTDCSTVSKELAAAMKRQYPPRLAWVNARRIVDDVLPLPEGPGFLIRSLSAGQVRWTLKVLQAGGSYAVYELPVRAQTPFAHLKADIRQGKIALLLWEYTEDGKPDGAPKPHLLIAELPSP